MKNVLDLHEKMYYYLWTIGYLDKAPSQTWTWRSSTRRCYTRGKECFCGPGEIILKHEKLTIIWKVEKLCMENFCYGCLTNFSPWSPQPLSRRKWSYRRRLQIRARTPNVRGISPPCFFFTSSVLVIELSLFFFRPFVLVWSNPWMKWFTSLSLK